MSTGVRCGGIVSAAYHYGGLSQGLAEQCDGSKSSNTQNFFKINVDETFSFTN